MKKIALLLMTVMLLSGCLASHNSRFSDYHADVYIENVPIDGASDGLTASGYIEISTHRDVPAVFNPYPSYYHLFPFASIGDANMVIV
jgi:hypothetical protein